MDTPDREQQIIQVHAGLIVNVVQATHNRELMPQLEGVLKASEENGWHDLVAAIRRVLEGERDPSRLLTGLDEEDSTIVQAILRGLQDPNSLPDPNAEPDPGMAAPGLAAMVQRASRGDTEALQLLAQMAEQMTNVGGDMGRLGGIMRRLVEGERDPEVLTRGMGAQGEQLVHSILEELGKLEAH